MNNFFAKGSTFEKTSVPRQVMFYDDAYEKMLPGILYKDVVICACCGSVFEVNEILRNAPVGQIALRVLKNWVDFSEEISD